MATPYSLSSIELEEERLLDTLLKNITNSIEELADLDEIVDDIERQDKTEKEAHVAAINHVTEFAFDYFKNQFLRAVVDTEEYNHPLFINHTERALEEHRNSLIYAESEGPGKIEIIIKTDLLGHADYWMDAAEKAYPKSKGIPDIDIRSVIWREKIYRVDREGGHVERDGKDVTDKFVGKWTETIQNRLNFISESHIPWWELINYGNSFFTGDGIPYPSIAPTYFIDTTIRAIEIAFFKFYNDVLAAFKFEENIELTEAAEAAIREYDPNIVPRLKAKKKEAEVYKIIDQINADQKAWELYLTSKGRIGLRYSLQRNVRR